MLAQVITPWIDVDTRITELASDGGSWYPNNTNGESSITSGQTIGVITGLFLLKGQMDMNIEWPIGYYVFKPAIPFRWTYQACIVDGSCMGSNPQVSVTIQDRSNWSDSIPTCPTLSGNIEHYGNFTIEPGWWDPYHITISSPGQCEAMVGGFKYEIFKTSPTPSVHTSAKVSRAMPIDATIAARDDSTVVNAPLVLSAGVEITSLSDAKVYIHFFPPFSTPKGAGMKAKTGAIVDGTIGAAVLILLVGLLVWRVRRKEKRQWKPIEDPLRT